MVEYFLTAKIEVWKVFVVMAAWVVIRDVLLAYCGRSIKSSQQWAARDVTAHSRRKAE